MLHLDDLQWGDADSAALLLEVLRPPDPPAVLIVAAYRTEDTQRSDFLAGFLPVRAREADPDDSLEIAIGPLAHEDAIPVLERIVARGENAPQEPGNVGPRRWALQAKLALRAIRAKR